MFRSSSAESGPVVVTRPSTLVLRFVSEVAVLIGRSFWMTNGGVEARQVSSSRWLGTWTPAGQKAPGKKKAPGTECAPKGPHCQIMPTMGTRDAADATPTRMASQTPRFPLNQVFDLHGRIGEQAWTRGHN
jgi:hypothetical protein